MRVWLINSYDPIPGEMLVAARVVFWSSVGLIGYAYLGYPVIMWVLARMKMMFARHETSAPAVALPRISLLVAAYNEKAVIAGKIRNALALDYPYERLEILVGSDGSTDETVNIARRVLPPGRGKVFSFMCRGKIFVLNDLVEASTWDLLVFTDANTMFEPDALRHLVRPFADDGVGCASGLLRLSAAGGHAGAGGEGFYWKYETFKKTQENVFQAVAGANGAIFAIRKELYQPLSPLTINDDFTTSMRVFLRGRRLVLVPQAVAHEDTAPTLLGEFRRHVRDSAGHFRAIVELRGLMNPLLGMPAFCFISHRLIRWLVPFLMIAALLSSCALRGHWPYAGFFWIQLVAYVAVAVAVPFAMNGASLGVLRIPFYFVLVNVAILAGFEKFVAGSQRSIWEPTART